jgi:uncharacterized protein YoaH (UPF0181 family)
MSHFRLPSCSYILHHRSAVEREEFVTQGIVTSLAMGMVAQYVRELHQPTAATMTHDLLDVFMQQVTHDSWHLTRDMKLT